jgi:hypothetical protein
MAVGTYHHPSVRMGTPQHVAAGNKTLSSVTKPIQAFFLFYLHDFKMSPFPEKQ